MSGLSSSTVLVSVALGVALVGCSAGSGHEPTSPAAASRASTTSAPSASSTATALPTTPAPVADGTYRVRISARDIVDAGGFDNQWGGTWTLTLDSGRYQLHCARVDTNSEQCGNSGDLGADLGMVVEVGRALGDQSTLWLVYDQASTLAVNGCTPCNPTNEQLAPYRMEWSLTGGGLVLKNLTAASGFNQDLPEPNNYTLRPWKKIA